MHLYNCTNTATDEKNSRFILSERDQISIWSIAVNALPMHRLRTLSIDKILLPRYFNLSIAVNAFPMHMLISFSVNKILLPMYFNLSIAVNAFPMHTLILLSIDQIRTLKQTHYSSSTYLISKDCILKHQSGGWYSSLFLRHFNSCTQNHKDWYFYLVKLDIANASYQQHLI